MPTCSSTNASGRSSRPVKSLRAALDASYDKAFSAIFDSNLTTLIAAFVLLWMATGTIKGFAITLIIGVIGCLFAALLVTKVLFGWLLEFGLLKKVTMWALRARAEVSTSSGTAATP